MKTTAPNSLLLVVLFSSIHFSPANKFGGAICISMDVCARSLLFYIIRLLLWWFAHAFEGAFISLSNFIRIHLVGHIVFEPQTIDSPLEY